MRRLVQRFRIRTVLGKSSWSCKHKILKFFKHVAYTTIQVTGWGYTKEGEDPSPELKEIQVPYVSYSACFEQVPSEFRAYLTHDKVCAGFLHEGM